MDLATAELVQQLRAGVDATVTTPRSIVPLVPVIDIEFAVGGTTLRWFSIVSTLGTPVDVTAQELRLEAFFPSDDQTERRWQDLLASPAPRHHAESTHRQVGGSSTSP